MSATSLLVIKADTLGDLVVFTPTIRALRAALPEARIGVVVREAYLDLGALIEPGVEWIGTSLDPFTEGPAVRAEELARLRAAVGGFNPDLAIAATSRRNWLETVLAADARRARRIAFTSEDDAFFATQLRVALGVEAAGLFEEIPPAPADEPDWKRNLRLASAALGRAAEATPPALTPGERGQTEVLAKAGLGKGRYAVCAPAGFANVRLKTWPAERFAAVIADLRHRHGLPTLLVGSAAERGHLEKIPGAAAIWTGGPGELTLLAGLLARAAVYVGNDTGAMHLAAATGVPVVGIFGGGTWPRFVPAARGGAAVVHPLPCFECGWDCAFGSAHCLDRIAVEDVAAAVANALGGGQFETRVVDRMDAGARTLIADVARRHRGAQAGHLARQRKLEELTQLDREKDREILAQHEGILDKEREIAALKTVCDEREKTIFILDGHVRHFQAENGQLKARLEVAEKTLAALPADPARAAAAIADQLVHIRNLEALRIAHEAELAELRRLRSNLTAGLQSLEAAKHYGRLLAEKEAVIRGLSTGLAERDRVIAELAAESSHSLAELRRLWLALQLRWREGVTRPLEEFAFRRLVEEQPMQIGVLRHHDPKPLVWDAALARRAGPGQGGPRIAMVTPSFGQRDFLGRTLGSVLEQAYPNLLYVVQDGGSTDGSVDVIRAHAGRLHAWTSEKDAGQADAIRRGFARVEGDLGPDDAMAWLNSDDLLAPGALAFVGRYFAEHPEVDVIYGHRIIIDENDGEVGRWVMPRHDPETLEWIDYVPQETMFWRKRAWDLAGGIDPTFQFALDWDLLARFQQAGCRMVRVPWFLGAFRVHSAQKTSQAIHTTGAEEMRRIRERFHGPRHGDHATIERFARRTRLRGALTARLLTLGIRW
jgi:ADP-heptose:LPS heptosyltransferase/GT2 family glycosyltransferase